MSTADIGPHAKLCFPSPFYEKFRSGRAVLYFFLFLFFEIPNKMPLKPCRQSYSHFLSSYSVFSLQTEKQFDTPFIVSSIINHVAARICRFKSAETKMVVDSSGDHKMKVITIMFTSKCWLIYGILVLTQLAFHGPYARMSNTFQAPSSLHHNRDGPLYMRTVSFVIQPLVVTNNGVPALACVL